MSPRHRHEPTPEGTRRFRLRERAVAVGDDMWVEDESGQRCFRVDGKVLRLRDTWVLEDPSGTEVAKIKERKLSIRDAITIHEGGRTAVVRKALIGIRDRFHVEVEAGQDLKIRGNVVDHDYQVLADGDVVAQVSKRWFRVRDTYGVEVRPGIAVPLAIAVTVAIDALAHD